jgi:hypothetical protein
VKVTILIFSFLLLHLIDTMASSNAPTPVDQQATSPSVEVLPPFPIRNRVEVTIDEILAIEHAMLDYEPLPKPLPSSCLEPLYAYDGGFEVLGQVETAYDLCVALEPRLLACPHVEFIRRVLCVILHGAKFIMLTDEWAPKPGIYGHLFRDERARMMTDLADFGNTLRRKITPVYDALVRRLRELDDPSVRHLANAPRSSVPIKYGPMVVYRRSDPK